VFAHGHLIIVTPPQAVLLPEPDDKERLVAHIIAINTATGRPSSPAGTSVVQPSAA
jgi:hypothetical protein